MVINEDINLLLVFDDDSKRAGKKVAKKKISDGKNFAAAVKKDKIEAIGEDLKPIS